MAQPVYDWLAKGWVSQISSMTFSNWFDRDKPLELTLGVTKMLEGAILHLKVKNYFTGNPKPVTLTDGCGVGLYSSFKLNLIYIVHKSSLYFLFLFFVFECLFFECLHVFGRDLFHAVYCT